MGFFRKREPDHSPHHFLEKIKEETSLLTQWLQYFYKKHDEHDIRIRLLEQHAHRKSEDPKLGLLEKQYAQLLTHFTQLQKRVAIILEAQEPVLKKIEEVEQKLTLRGEDTEALRELHQKLSLLEGARMHDAQKAQTLPAQNARLRLAQKIAKKSKEYIKHTLLSLIAKYGRISGLQLREIAVEEQNLCSKSTFYRLLAELEQEEELGSVREAKEKVYFSQLEKPIIR